MGQAGTGKKNQTPPNRGVPLPTEMSAVLFNVVTLNTTASEVIGTETEDRKDQAPSMCPLSSSLPPIHQQLQDINHMGYAHPVLTDDPCSVLQRKGTHSSKSLPICYGGK